MHLHDKIAIVTGGSRDIGREVSIRLAAAGARVCVHFANDTAAASDTLREIEAAGDGAILQRADVTGTSCVEPLLATARKAFGSRIDIPSNFAGGLVARRLLAEIDEAFFDRVMTLNLKSTYLMTWAVAPHMPEGAPIINFASLAARDGKRFGSARHSRQRRVPPGSSARAFSIRFPGLKCARRSPPPRHCAGKGK